ncbi:MAG: T9SS type A sorting domain-containing protein [Bacteroidetes bacterium]|nr:T9SS type A sorting domain-containing protein [Bacteroidota bacterium]
MKKFILLSLTLLVSFSVLDAQSEFRTSDLRIDSIQLTPWFAVFDHTNQPTQEQFFQWLNSGYLKNENISWTIKSDNTDELGIRHIRFSQLLNYTPITDATVILHIVNNKVSCFNGEIFSKTESAINPTGVFNDFIPETKTGEIIEFDSKNPVCYTADENGNLKLCFVFIKNIDEVDQLKLFVDVSDNNRVIRIDPLEISADSKGKATTYYQGQRDITTDSLNKSLFRLRENGKPIHTFYQTLGTDFYDKDNNWNDTGILVAGDIHFGSELLLDYLKKIHNWNSLSNSKDSVTSLVNFTNGGNASWNLNNNYVTFLVRPTAAYGPCASIDVLGHEFGHGMADETAGLVYKGESCMLHESFGDINGTMLEWYLDSTKFNWLLGEQVWKGGIRDMSDPKKFGHPNAYNGKGFGKECHADGGVQNYWYYLMTEGDTGTNDFGYSYALKGLGIHKAMKIMYRSLFYYWTANTDYKKATTYSLAAANDLYGICSEELQHTIDAWAAVGLSDTSFKTADLSHGIKAPKVLCTTFPKTLQIESYGDKSRNVTWYLANGDSSNNFNIIHTQNKSGTATFLLKTDVCNAEYFDTLTIDFSPFPVADFSLNKNHACLTGNDTVITKNTSVNPDKDRSLLYEWTLNPYDNHYYSTDLKIPVTDPFSLNLILKTYYENGCMDTASANISVHEVPVVSFETIPNCSGSPIKVKNTTDTTKAELQFTWKVDNQNAGNAFLPDYTLFNAGKFKIEMEVIDAYSGCSANASSLTTVNPNPVPDFILINPCKNVNSTLINTTKHDTGANYFRWRLPEFNPYNKDTLALTVTEDSLPVTLEFRDLRGCMGTTQKTFTLETINAVITGKDSICAGKDLKLSATIQPTNAIWKLSDESGQIAVSDVKNIALNYTEPGFKKINLNVQSDKCELNKEFVLNILRNPSIPEFDVSGACKGSAVICSNFKQESNTSMTWEWGDGETSGISDSTHIYGENTFETENYMILLGARNTAGCATSFIQNVTVYGNTDPDFNAVRTDGLEFQLTPSKATDPTFIYEWTFSDGEKSQLRSPVHEFKLSSDTQTFVWANLRITNSDGCISELKKQINVSLSVNVLNTLSVKLFPNPTTGELNISGLKTGTNASIEVLDINGRMVLTTSIQSPSNDEKLDITVSPGIYLVQIEQGKLKSYQRLVISE